MKTLATKTFALATATMMICSAGLCSCAGSKPSSSSLSSSSAASISVETSTSGNSNTMSSNTSAASSNSAVSQQSAKATAVDVSSWQWLPATLDCYGYTSKTGPCHVDYQWPNGFRVQESNDSGEQIRTYWFNPDPSKQSQDDSEYYVSLMFMQGGYGPTQSSLEPDVEGGLQTRQIGGRDVLFGKMKATTKPDGTAYTGYTYTYYIPYDDEGWARIWILLTDQEENGLFRQTFENSLAF